MKVLWLVNLVLPKACELLGFEKCSAGGWIVGQLTQLEKRDGVEMTVVAPGLVDELKTVAADGVKYYVFDSRKSDYTSVFSGILEKEKPDLVHIFGTEYKHTLDMLTVCDRSRCVVNIQGIMSTCAESLLYGLPRRYQSISLPKKLIRLLKRYGGNIKADQQTMARAAKIESASLRLAKNVIGRTNWDKAVSGSINPELRYYHCDEILRDSFYDGKWSLDGACRHMILLSQANYPIKGLHLVLPHLPALVKRYPDLRVVVCGRDPMYHGRFEWLFNYLQEYQAYLKKLISEYSLDEHVEFVGFQTEAEMKRLYLKANVFLSCSTIENESNSLSEARMLGLPSVCSFCGGMTERMRHGEDGFFYPLGEEYMIPEYVSRIFDDDRLCSLFSERSSAMSRRINDRESNTNTLLGIYDSILADANRSSRS